MEQETLLIQSNISNGLIADLSTGNKYIDLVISILISSIITWCFNYIKNLNLDLSYWNKYKYVTIHWNPISSFPIGDEAKLIKCVLDFCSDKLNLSDEIIGLKSREKATDSRYLEELSREFRHIPNLSWVSLREPYSYISIKYIEKVISDGNGATTDISLIIRTNKSQEDIYIFLKKCYHIWAEKTYSKSEKDQYLIHHMMESEKSSTMKYMVYPITYNVSFSDIFFPEKDKILNLLDRFKSGKTLSKKLSFLLHGPPGTGKTSFIKALAKQTQRYVFYIKISQITTMESAMNLFFSDEIESGRHIYHFPIKNRIYVFEDIDAENDIVQNRQISPIKNPSTNDIELLTLPKITLSDILQILDGIHELSGAILVMTTNHKDKLDPALIRPGRITMEIHLKELTQDNAIQLIAHTFNEELTGDWVQRARDLIPDNLFLPANIECLCHESHNIDDFLKRLESVKIHG